MTLQGSGGTMGAKDAARREIKAMLEQVAERQGLVDIGQALGIEVVGEGVETLEHAEILRDLGCAVLQGYALARPNAAMSNLSHL